jgi:hypothetical protein
MFNCGCVFEMFGRRFVIEVIVCGDFWWVFESFQGEEKLEDGQTKDEKFRKRVVVVW